RYIKRVLADRPNDLDLHERRVRLANWAGDYAQAEASLRVLTAARPGDTNLKRDLARVLSWQSRTADAADVFAEIVAQHPDDKDALLELSRLETRLGDVRRASELLRQYRDAGGDEQTYHRELAELPAQAALAAEGEKRWPKAEHTYREMLAGEPN